MFKPWMTLASKELRLNLYSLSGIIFMLLFLTISGCMLWLVPGDYNIPDKGYASLSAFFSLAPVLLLFLIPALSMRSLADEKRMQTLMLLKSRPLSPQAIVSAKIAAIFATILITLSPTLIYGICIHYYGSPTGNPDWGAIAASYMGLSVLSLAFTCLCIFASSLASNSMIALITGMLLCVFFYYGWNLTGLDALSFLSHYRSVQRGLIETRDLAYLVSVALAAASLTVVIIDKTYAPLGRKQIALILLSISGLIFNFRFDCTQDKRYTIHPASKAILKTLEYPVEIEMYLTGNLNPGFARLQEEVLHLLNDFDKLSKNKISCRLIDPYRKGREFTEELNHNQLAGVSVNERSDKGQWTQHVVYPYALVKYNDLQIPVSLLINRIGYSGEDNLNLSSELLEYRLAHAIQLLSQKTSKRIVFLEGHGEFSEEAISEITDWLSYEYTIDRGKLSGRQGELNMYSLVIIAGPQAPFPEADKWALDQYLMQGGSLLWLVNGMQLHSCDDLVHGGETLAKAEDLNLNDLFFTYGCRINPVILQDIQCLNIPVAQTDATGQTDYVSKPWYYAPLLIPDQRSEITKGLSRIKTKFASTLSFVGDNTAIRKEVLLTSSSYARTIALPARVSLDETDRKPDKTNFNEANLPIAALLQGKFPSAFQNRNLFATQPLANFLPESQSAKMAVIASDELITNPLAYDTYSQTFFSNAEFIQNVANFLTDDTGLSALRNKSLQMRLLNKQALQRDHNRIVWLLIATPPCTLLAAFIALSIRRKRKYNRL